MVYIMFILFFLLFLCLFFFFCSFGHAVATPGTQRLLLEQVSEYSDDDDDDNVIILGKHVTCVCELHVSSSIFRTETRLCLLSLTTSQENLPLPPV